MSRPANPWTKLEPTRSRGWRRAGFRALKAITATSWDSRLRSCMPCCAIVVESESQAPSAGLTLDLLRLDSTRIAYEQELGESILKVDTLPGGRADVQTLGGCACAGALRFCPKFSIPQCRSRRSAEFGAELDAGADGSSRRRAQDQRALYRRPVGLRFARPRPATSD